MRDQLIGLATWAVVFFIAYMIWHGVRELNRRADALNDWFRDYENALTDTAEASRRKGVLALVARAGTRKDGVPAEDDPFLRTSVDEFLERAFTNNLPIDRPGEWADDHLTTMEQAYGEVPEPEDPPKVGPKKRTHPLPVLEPPLTRLHCTGCGNRWDAWVDDGGNAEDPRDLLCHCGGEVVNAVE